MVSTVKLEIAMILATWKNPGLLVGVSLLSMYDSHHFDNSRTYTELLQTLAQDRKNHRYAPLSMLCLHIHGLLPLSASVIEAVTPLLSNTSIASLTNCSDWRRPNKRDGGRGKAQIHAAITADADAILCGAKCFTRTFLI